MWRKYYLNDTSIKNLCETPEQLRLPVGSLVHVRKGLGYQFNNLWYRAIPAYVTDNNIPRLRDICSSLEGFTLLLDKPLTENEWRRGWVDEYYPLSDRPVFKCYMPGMIRVQLRLTDPDVAKTSITSLKNVPVCPTCSLTDYENVETRKVFDQAMRYFIHFWLHGQTYNPEDKGERV